MQKDSLLYPIEEISEDPKNPRKTFVQSHIDGLAVSISREGIINPLELDSSGIIITGHCRFRAAKQLGWTEVPVIINDQEYTEYERLRHQIAENVHQSGSVADAVMNPLDVANGYARLIRLKLGKDVEPGSESWFRTTYGSGVTKTLAEEIGVDQKTIEEYLKLLEEPEFVQKDIQRGRPRTHYREANAAPEEVKDQIKEKIAAGDYTSREEIVQDVSLVKKFPDMAVVELERKKAKASAGVNRILNHVARLGLALEAFPLHRVDPKEVGIITKQLEWIKTEIEGYLLDK